MSQPIHIPVDVTNPGQFFACCGLLELASLLWPGAAGGFCCDLFAVQAAARGASLQSLLEAFQRADLSVDDAVDAAGAEDDDNESGRVAPMMLGAPFNMALGWWSDKQLKPWAGSMNARLIFTAMRGAIRSEADDPLNHLSVVHDPAEPASPGSKKATPKKREPFYFDSRRGASAKSLDVGFSPDRLGMTTAACPAVESLCVVGLQRFRPMPTQQPRVFVYRAWTTSLPPSTAAAAACGMLPGVGGDIYRFENAFRTDQRKHKGFLSATRISEGDTQ
ncbi:MAG: hypothetical protein U0574_01620 [Phycisphaerales bacterium]